MAITLEANYSKKLGLPQFSSHQYSVTVRTEIADITQVEKESTRLYQLLQDAVDREIQQEGWLPGSGQPNGNTTATTTGQTPPNEWNCSERQRDLILKIVDENGLDRNKVDTLATERFGHGVREVNRLEASALIDELFEMSGARTHSGSKHFSFRRQGNARGRRAR